jgi:DNA-binding LytR/AlgR family response regulator
MRELPAAKELSSLDGAHQANSGHRYDQYAVAAFEHGAVDYLMKPIAPALQSDTKYTRVVTGDSESLIRKPLKELSNELDPSQFWQIHRSTIVNVNAIAGVSRQLSGALVVKLKNRQETLPASQQFVHRFRQM